MRQLDLEGVGGRTNEVIFRKRSLLVKIGGFLKDCVLDSGQVGVARSSWNVYSVRRRHDCSGHLEYGQRNEGDSDGLQRCGCSGRSVQARMAERAQRRCTRSVGECKGWLNYGSRLREESCR
jgi:hypothetical protein